MKQQPVERRLAAILVADAAGYSRRMGEDEVGTLRALAEHRDRVLKPEIAAHRGRIVKSTGDGLLVEFASAVDAVACAVAIQRAMAGRNAELAADRRIEFRIGINIGDIVVEGGDIYGDGVNVAARLEALAEPGGLCIADAVHEQIQGKLPYAFADWGAKTVKNILHPVHVHGLGAAAIAALAEARTGASPSRRARLGGSPRLWWSAALGGTAMAVLALAAWLALAPTPPATGRFSIVVLPFSALNAEPGQDYLANILNEEVTTSLARLLPGRVIARSTAYTYRGKPVDVKQLGKELGVRYVLEGSEQHDAKQVRLDAQLIDAASGTQLWADQFDAGRADLLQMQDDLVTRVSRALQLQLMDVEAARVVETTPANLDAEDLAMRCVAGYVDGPPGSSASAAALQLCSRALKIDPRNVRALILVAQQDIDRVNDFQSTERDADIRHADELVSRALAIDPNFYGAHGAKAAVLIAEQRFDDAVFEAQRALDLNPAFIPAYISLCTANNLLGRPEQAIEYADRAMRISPRDPQLSLFYLQKGLALLLLNENGQALDWLRRTTLAAPDWPIPHAILAAALAQAGHEGEAHAELQRFLSFPTTKARTIAQWRAQLPSTKPEFLAKISAIIEGMRKAGMPEQ